MREEPMLISLTVIAIVIAKEQTVGVVMEATVNALQIGKIDTNNFFNTVWLGLTYQCNSKCKWCYVASETFVDKPKEELKNPRETVELLKELCVPKVILIGGEPTLYSNISQLISDLRNENIGVGMISNGRKFSSEAFTRDMHKRGLNYVTFSLEGSNSQIHDDTTQCPGSFNQLIKGVKNAQTQGLRVTTNTNMSSLNISNLEKIIDLVSSLGIGTHTFNACGACLTKDNSENYMLRTNEYASAFQSVYFHALNKGVKSRLITPLPKCNFSRLEELKDKKAIPSGPCQVVTGRNFVIDYNGDILPCTHFSGFPFFNIFENKRIIDSKSFLDRYFSEQANQFRNRMNRYPSVKCNPCGEKCTGGCPIFWTKYNPESEISIPKE